MSSTFLKILNKLKYEANLKKENTIKSIKKNLETNEEKKKKEEKENSYNYNNYNTENIRTYIPHNSSFYKEKINNNENINKIKNFEIFPKIESKISLDFSYKFLKLIRLMIIYFINFLKKNKVYLNFFITLFLFSKRNFILQLIRKIFFTFVVQRIND